MSNGHEESDLLLKLKRLKSVLGWQSGVLEKLESIVVVFNYEHADE